MKEEIQELNMTGIIRKLLYEKPKTRDDDELLIDLVREHFKQIHFVKNGIFKPYKHLTELYKSESITRLRRKIQQQEREKKDPKQWVLQPSRIINDLRRIEENEMRDINIWWKDNERIGKQSLLFPYETE